MIKHTSLVAVAAALGILTSAAHAQDKVKVGVIATLSGPPAVLGQQLRNGFALAVKNLGGKLGGVDAEVIVADDELKPDVAVTKVKSLIDRYTDGSSLGILGDPGVNVLKLNIALDNQQ